MHQHAGAKCTIFMVQNAPVMWCKMHHKTGAKCTSMLCKMHQLCGANFTSNWCKMHQLDADANCTSQRQNCTSKLVQNAPVIWCKFHQQLVQCPQFLHQFRRTQCPQIHTNFATSTPTPSSTMSLAFRG
ncbi:hypothetical protein Adt_46403 [Abeliophyllum distichum]|uniref:Uncharacterized protein n=1 Tax=Abeliophyllum distichum TaxID=126358 RepID=A0ABD1P120_9LAMI